MLSLYTGAGGLDLGLEAAGFQIAACLENDQAARCTVVRNRPNWMLIQPGDVYEHDSEDILAAAGLDEGDVAVLSGGPPCQPFSKARYWLNGSAPGIEDPRARTLEALMDIAHHALPDVLLIENVRGMATPSVGALALIRNRLEATNRARNTSYVMSVLSLEASQYGVPQKRNRLFVLATRDGQAIDAPPPTHSSLNLGSSVDGLEPFRTAWDAIGGMTTSEEESLSASGEWGALLPSIPEGENYLWHTRRKDGDDLFGWRTRYWSFLLKLAKALPSWTISASPGPSTGPFHWLNRRLSRLEMARLQTFPTDFVVEGSYAAARRQLGNAVPPALGELIGLQIRRQRYGADVPSQLSLVPSSRADCPPPEPATSVPKRYWHLRGRHADHPGVGKGPGARKREAPSDAQLISEGGDHG